MNRSQYLNKGNQGNFYKPFAQMYGLYAAVLLGELMYLNENRDNYFYRTFKDLAFSIGLKEGVLKDKRSKNNPLNVLKDLGLVDVKVERTGQNNMVPVTMYKLDLVSIGILLDGLENNYKNIDI